MGDYIQNNIRLTQCLSGPAGALVASFLVDPENLSQIIKDIEEKLLTESQISILSKQSQIFMMINLADQVRNCKNFLLSCNCGAYLDNPLLVKEISDKLPLSKRLEWMKKEATLPKSSLIEMSKCMAL